MILVHSEQLFCVIIERKLLSIISSIYTIHNSSILNAKTFLNVLLYFRVKFNILTISISYIQIDLNHYLNRNKYKSLISKSSCHHELFDIACFFSYLKAFHQGLRLHDGCHVWSRKWNQFEIYAPTPGVYAFVAYLFSLDESMAQY